MMRRTQHGRRRDPSKRIFPALGIAGLVVIGLVFYVAFTAHSGLPLESRYNVFVDVPDGDRITPDADVQIGGITVGRVAGATAVIAGHGRPPYARLSLSLQPSAGPLPIDTTVKVRPQSVLGLTYIDLQPGRSSRTIPPDGTVPLSHASATVDLTDLFNIFTRRTARNFQAGMTDLSAGFDGQGPALNTTIAYTNRLVPALTKVAATLANPQTRLGPFIEAYESTLSALGPVSPQFAGVVSAGATTLGAFARERPAIAGTLDAAPSAEAASTTAFTELRPALAGVARLSKQLLPAIQGLPGTLRAVNTTLPVGLRPLHQLPQFSGALRTTLTALRTVARVPATLGAVRKLTGLFDATNTLMTVLAPAQMHCDVVPLWAQNFGSYMRAFGSGAGPAINEIGLTTSGATGEELQNAKPSPNVGIDFIPHENAQECQSGEEPYTGKQDLTNPAGDQNAPIPTTNAPAASWALAKSAGLLTTPVGAP